MNMNDMENRFERIETTDYILVVSNGKIVYPEPYFVSNSLGDRIEIAETKPSGVVKKIIGYEPKNNALELDIPLLPELSVEDDVEKLAKEEFKGFEDQYDKWRFGINGFIKGHKAATKVYSEEDLMKAIEMAREEFNSGIKKYLKQDIIQSLKQSKIPKWFVAEMEMVIYPANMPKEGEDRPVYRLKTTTNSEGKKVLVGTYE
jgi:hypothetical protein